MCDSCGCLQSTGAGVRDNICYTSSTDFQRAAVELHSPRTQRGCRTGDHGTIQNGSATRIIIFRIDGQFALSLLRKCHATRELAALGRISIPGVILCAIYQHTARGNNPHQSHGSSPLITEHNSDTILIFVINLILFPVEGGGVPLAIGSFIGPGGGH